MITKTQIRIMKIFVSRITDKFSIKQVSEIMKKPYALVHRSIIPLIKEGLITKDEKELLFLNYRENLAELAYIESIRKNAERMKQTSNLESAISSLHKPGREERKIGEFAHRGNLIRMPP